jgi:hypothetical protein
MPKGHFLYGAGVCAPRGKVTSSCITNLLNYCAEFIVLTDLRMWNGGAQYNLTGRRFQTHDLNFETPLKSRFSIIRQKFEISFVISIVKPTRCSSFSNLFYFVVVIYMFRTVFPSIIRSLRLYIQHQVCHTGSADCLLAGTRWKGSSLSFPLASSHQNLFDIHLKLYVQF